MLLIKNKWKRNYSILNEFIKDSFYFDNFYHQTGQGKTSDAEFIVENSLYPLDRGSVFFTHATNEYTATPEQLKNTDILLLSSIQTIKRFGIVM